MRSIETGVVRPEPQAEAQDRPTRVLLADDQADVLTALRLMLKAEGFEAEAIKRASIHDPKTTRNPEPGRPCSAASQQPPTTPVVAMTNQPNRLQRTPDPSVHGTNSHSDSPTLTAIAPLQTA